MGLTLGHHTLAHNTSPSRQLLSADKLCQSQDMHAVGWADRQTLLSGTDKAQRQTAEGCLMTPRAHLSITTFPDSQGSLEMPQIPSSDVKTDKQKAKMG